MTLIRVIGLLASALILAVLCTLPITASIFPFSIIAAGSFVMDTMFHELGHSVFGWLFGYINIPMIFTLFHADQMGGMALIMGHSDILQAAMVLALAFGCYQIRISIFFIPAIIFTIIIAVISVTGNDQLAIDYMGHGSAIITGGYFLYRAFANLAPRGGLERWLSAYFGFLLVFRNIFFSYRLITDADYSEQYTNAVEFIGHHDFVKVSEALSVSINSIAIFTIGLGIVVIIAAFVASLFAPKY